MGAQLRAPIKPLNATVLWCTGCFRRPRIGPPWCREKFVFAVLPHLRFLFCWRNFLWYKKWRILNYSPCHPRQLTHFGNLSTNTRGNESIYQDCSDLVRTYRLSDWRTEKYFWNLVIPNQIWKVITLFWLILHQTEFRLVSNQSEKCINNPNMVPINQIRKSFPRAKQCAGL